MSTAIPLAAKYDKSGIFTPEIVSVLEAAVPILLGIRDELGMDEDMLVLGDGERFDGRWSAIVTRCVPLNLIGNQVVPVMADTDSPMVYTVILSFMDVNWQNDNPPNPADAAIGPQGYDNHLYYR